MPKSPEDFDQIKPSGPPDDPKQILEKKKIADKVLGPDTHLGSRNSEAEIEAQARRAAFRIIEGTGLQRPAEDTEPANTDMEEAPKPPELIDESRPIVRERYDKIFKPKLPT